jgi:uracil-DNA glycosylase
VEPQVILCLGATAAQSLLGTSFRVSTQRGHVVSLPSDAEWQFDPEPSVIATVHPSAVLRDRSDRRDEAFTLFVDDLRSAHAVLAGS